MAAVWRKPLHVVIELENKQCRILNKFASLGLKQLKVVDIRSSNPTAVKHLIEFNRDQAVKIPKGFLETEAGRWTEGRPSMWFESEG